MDQVEIARQPVLVTEGSAGEIVRFDGHGHDRCSGTVERGPNRGEVALRAPERRHPFVHLVDLDLAPRERHRRQRLEHRDRGQPAAQRQAKLPPRRHRSSESPSDDLGGAPSGGIGVRQHLKPAVAHPAGFSSCPPKPLRIAERRRFSVVTR
jgi:hypothetical protein